MCHSSQTTITPDGHPVDAHPRIKYRRKHEFHMEVVRTHHSREVIKLDFDRYMAVIDRYIPVTNLHDRYNRYTPECPQALGLPALWEGVKR